MLLLMIWLWRIPSYADQSRPSSQETQNNLNELVSQHYPFLEDLYRYFHSHPELSFSETKTAFRLAGELKAIGFEVSTKIGGHGVMGILKNRRGPTVMIRTDMDALPITEETDLPYASNIRTKDKRGRDEGVMHAAAMICT